MRLPIIYFLQHVSGGFLSCWHYATRPWQAQYDSKTVQRMHWLAGLVTSRTELLYLLFEGLRPISSQIFGRFSLDYSQPPFQHWSAVKFCLRHFQQTARQIRQWQQLQLCLCLPAAPSPEVFRNNFDTPLCAVAFSRLARPLWIFNQN